MSSNTPEASAIASPSTSSELSYQKMILCAAVIGIAGGLVATIYYYTLEACLHFVWHTILEFLAPYISPEIAVTNYVWIATTIGGFLAGLTLHLMGLPGEVAFVVDKVHQPGRISQQQTPAMIVASLVSITFGGSAGPEAPLVQINGSLGSWLGHKLQLTATTVRVLTFCGMSAALGAFFGEKEIATIVKTGSTFGLVTLVAIAAAKMLAVSCTIHSGFRGGFIFPLFYIGAAVGLATSLGIPQIHPTIGMICMMAAVNVANTKTPISTTIILSF